jgi:hypothetical protein
MQEEWNCLVTIGQNGPKTISELIDSYSEHLINHERQIERILAA